MTGFFDVCACIPVAPASGVESLMPAIRPGIFVDAPDSPVCGAMSDDGRQH
jgi:hypothetical protein